MLKRRNGARQYVLILTGSGGIAGTRLKQGMAMSPLLVL